MKLKLQWPLKDIYIIQRFGKDPATYSQLGIKGHNGIDFRAPHGTSIYASHDGLASYQVDSSGGHGVVVITNQEFEGTDGVSSLWKTIYWHMVDGLKEPKLKSPIADKTGFIPVKQGELIGYADNTGFSKGDHLHFGLKPVAKGENWGTYFNVEQNNGYGGAVDPEPYLPSISVPFPRIMKMGDTSDDVSKLQSFLLRKKFIGPIYTGFGTYGPRTRDAVKKYQISKGIKDNGGIQCGELTLKALNQDYDL